MSGVGKVNYETPQARIPKLENMIRELEGDRVEVALLFYEMRPSEEGRG